MPALEEIEATKKKFTGRCRLFVGNLPNDMAEEELKKLFEEFGEIAECYMSGKGFAFIRLVHSLPNTNLPLWIWRASCTRFPFLTRAVNPASAR